MNGVERERGGVRGNSVRERVNGVRERGGRGERE